jgi:hypothetical protein
MFLQYKRGMRYMWSDLRVCLKNRSWPAAGDIGFGQSRPDESIDPDHVVPPAVSVECASEARSRRHRRPESRRARVVNGSEFIQEYLTIPGHQTIGFALVGTFAGEDDALRIGAPSPSATLCRSTSGIGPLNL